MSSDGASQVLEEVAPVAMRGKETNAMIRVSGCNEARMTDYEKVVIMRTTHTCGRFESRPGRAHSNHLQAGHLPETKNAVYSKSALTPVVTGEVKPLVRFRR